MDQKQNAQVEKLARDAATGKKPYRWQSTILGETPTAQATDPARIASSGGGPTPGVGWWQHVDAFVDRALRRGKYARDSKEAENTAAEPRGSSANEIAEHQHEHEREENEGTDSYKFGDYLPEDSEDAYAWLVNLHIYVEETPGRKPYFDALAKFVNEYPVGTRGEALDKERLMALLEDLCGAPGGLLKRREAA